MSANGGRRRASELTFGDATPPTATPPTASPAAPAAPQPEPTAGNALASISSDLPRYLGGKGETDNGNGAVSIPLSRLMARPPLDPDLDLVSKGIDLPRYLERALSFTAYASGRRQREIVADALRAYLDPEIVAEARRATGA